MGEYHFQLYFHPVHYLREMEQELLLETTQYWWEAIFLAVGACCVLGLFLGLVIVLCRLSAGLRQTRLWFHRLDRDFGLLSDLVRRTPPVAAAPASPRVVETGPPLRTTSPEPNYISIYPKVPQEEP